MGSVPHQDTRDQSPDSQEHQPPTEQETAYGPHDAHGPKGADLPASFGLGPARPEDIEAEGEAERHKPCADDVSRADSIQFSFSLHATFAFSGPDRLFSAPTSARAFSAGLANPEPWGFLEAECMRVLLKVRSD